MPGRRTMTTVEYPPMPRPCTTLGCMVFTHVKGEARMARMWRGPRGGEGSLEVIARYRVLRSVE